MQRADLRLTLRGRTARAGEPVPRRHVRQRPADLRRRPPATVDGRLDRLPRRARARPRRVPLPEVDRPRGRSVPLRRPRQRRPALRPARERPSRRNRPLARRHPLLAIRDVRPRALPEAGIEPRVGHRLELRDAGARGADHRPHRLRRAGRRRRGAVCEHRRLLGVRAGTGPPAVARGPEAASRRGATVPRRGPGRTARRRAVRLERGRSFRPGSTVPAAGSRPSSRRPPRPARSPWDPATS